MITLDPAFLKALPVIEKIERAGYEAFFVGGSVRDALLKKEINDIDIATSAFPEEIKALFKRTVDIGIEHGTVIVLWKDLSFEVTTFRAESDYQDFRRPDHVVFVHSLEEDLKRRDFTINALAMNSEGQLVDYFDGVKDLNLGIVRTVGPAKERFHEDALRMIRGIRFVSQLDFVMERETEKAISRHCALLKKIAVERIQIEFTKLLLGKGRQKGLRLLIRTDLYSYCPDLKTHQKGLEAYADLEGYVKTALNAWILLLFFLNKPLTEAEVFLRKWKKSKKEIQQIKVGLKALYFREKHLFDRQTLYHIGLETALSVEHLAELLGYGSNPAKVTEDYQRIPITSRRNLAVTGNDLLQKTDILPGKWLGALLDEIERSVIEGELPNKKETILKWADERIKKMEGE